MPTTFSVQIVFADGEILKIDGATAYGYHDTASSYYVEKNGYRQFFNKEYVKYIGRYYDLP